MSAAMSRIVGVLAALGACTSDGPGVNPLEGLPTEGAVEPAPPLLPGQSRAVMIVQDLSASMVRALPGCRDGAVRYLFTMLDQDRPGDLLGQGLFAEFAAQSSGRAALTDTTPPWAVLTPVYAEGVLRERFSHLCCPDEPLVPDVEPVTIAIGGCTNAEPALRQAVAHLERAAPAGAFRAIVLVSGQRFTCGGEFGGARAAADDAWSEGIHIWTIQVEGTAESLVQVPLLTRGSGFFQFVPDVDDVPQAFATAAAALPVEAP